MSPVLVAVLLEPVHHLFAGDSGKLFNDSEHDVVLVVPVSFALIHGFVIDGYDAGHLQHCIALSNTCLSFFQCPLLEVRANNREPAGLRVVDCRT